METFLLVPFLNRAAEFDPAAWFQLVPKGSFPISRKEGDTVRHYVQVVDDIACQRIVQAFANRQAAAPGHRLLVDFEHFSHDTEKSSAAACWVTAMQARADGVWAQGEWSDQGEAAIKNRRYRFLSPVWFPRQTEQLGGNRFRPIEVNDAGLTNKPNLGDALQPFWNREFNGREAINPTQPEKTMKDRLIPLLKLDATASEDQIVAQITAFMNRASQLDALQGTHATLQSEHTALKNRHATLLTAAVDQTLAEFGDVLSTPEAQTAWKNRLTSDFDGTRALLVGIKPAKAAGADEAKVTAALDTYKGVITAESREAWKNRLTADYDGTVALLKGIKPPKEKKQPLHKSGGGKGAVDTDDHPFMNRVSELRTADPKLSESDAIVKAATDNADLYEDYRASLRGE